MFWLSTLGKWSQFAPPILLTTMHYRNLPRPRFSTFTNIYIVRCWRSPKDSLNVKNCWLISKHNDRQCRTNSSSVTFCYSGGLVGGLCYALHQLDLFRSLEIFPPGYEVHWFFGGQNFLKSFARKHWASPFPKLDQSRLATLAKYLCQQEKIITWV